METATFIGLYRVYMERHPPKQSFRASANQGLRESPGDFLAESRKLQTNDGNLIVGQLVWTNWLIYMIVIIIMIRMNITSWRLEVENPYGLSTDQYDEKHCLSPDRQHKTCSNPKPSTLAMRVSKP